MGLTQPLTEKKYQDYFLWGKGSRCVGLTNLPPSCADCPEIWEPQPPGISGPVQACNWITLLYFTLLYFTLLYFTLLYFTLLY